jgi:two-component system OmpR family sensor kinase
VVKIEGERVHHQLMLLHKKFGVKLRFPHKQGYESAIYDIDERLIFETCDISDDIDFTKEFDTKDGYIYHIKKVDPYYLGAAYLLLIRAIDYSDIVYLREMISIFMVGAGIFFLVIGYFLGGLFIAPMRESIEMMNDFIQDTTHELNTPISTILTNVELIETLKKCNAKEEMRRIEIASKTLSRIYDDLTYLKLHHNYHREIEPIDISSFVEERVRYFSSSIESKRLELETHMAKGVIIDIDRDDAIRLVDNIISNAIKYNRVGAALDITLTTKVLKVKDGGIGIEERDLHQIFDRFRRANKSEGGFGIGLNIVYQLTQLYGFDIDIVSKPNIGTEVIIKWQK